MARPTKQNRQPEPGGWRKQLADLVKTVAYGGAIALLPRVVLAQPFTIPSASMEPTLQQGDYILVSKFSYGWSRYSVPLSPPVGDGRLLGRSPDRGDVVVFRLPRNDRVDYIKRVIGLPGDTIQVRDGEVLINGKEAQRSPIGSEAITCPQGYGERVEAPVYEEKLPSGRSHPLAACFNGVGGANNTAVYTVPKGCYFVMGITATTQWTAASNLPTDRLRPKPWPPVHSIRVWLKVLAAASQGSASCPSKTSLGVPT